MAEGVRSRSQAVQCYTQPSTPYFWSQPHVVSSWWLVLTVSGEYLIQNYKGTTRSTTNLDSCHFPPASQKCGWYHAGHTLEGAPKTSPPASPFHRPHWSGPGWGWVGPAWCVVSSSCGTLIPGTPCPSQRGISGTKQQKDRSSAGLL